MGKQRCGTCRFFEDAGLAGSGWCHHPLRKTTSDLLIMVRRNELACRDEWSHSLWEPGAFGETPEAPAGPAAPAVAPGRPMPPATEQEIAALMKSAAADDVVLAEARIVSRARPAWRPLEAPEPEPPSRGAYDAKTALRRAREAYRERARQQAAQDVVGPAPLAASAPASVEAEPVAAAALVAPESATAEPVVAARAPDPELQTEVEEPAVAVAMPAFDAVGDAELPALETGVEPDAVAAQAADDESETDAADWEPDDHEPDAFGPVAADHWATPREAVAIAPIVGGRFRPLVEPASDEPLEPLATPWSVASADPDLDAWWSSERIDDPARAWERWDDEAWSPEEFLEPHETAPSEPAPRAEFEPFAEPEGDDGAEDVAAEAPAAGAATFDRGAWDVEAIAAAAAIAPGPALAWSAGRGAPPVALAPTIPRICRTCRDFRPAEGGERGWCANKWAFTHRRVVGANDAAPCESSIGCWWLPADDLCLSDADISTHGQPTPHLDRWLERWKEREVERRRS